MKTILEETALDSGSDLMEWRRELGISRKLFAEMADFSERTLATCEKAYVIPDSVARPVRETVRLIRALRDLATDGDSLKNWLQTANPAFDGETPIALIKSGESDRLWEMVHQIRHGEFA